MSTIVTRAGKGSALTNTEVDSNFTNLNTDKIEAATTVTLTNKTLTSPKINEILDTSGNEILGLSATASATDFLTVKNGIGTGVPLHVYADGPSTNIGLHIQPKGTGLVTISDGTDFNKGIRFRSSGSAASAVTLLDAVSTAGRVVTLPDATTTLVGRDTTDTLTNKTINLTSNTLVATSAQILAAITDETGTGSLVFANTPTLVTPVLGTPTSGNFSTGTFTWPTFNQNTTGTAAGLSATLATTSGGTGLTSFTSGGVVYASSSSALATGSALTFDGTTFGLNPANLLMNNSYTINWKNASGVSSAVLNVYSDNNLYIDSAYGSQIFRIGSAGSPSEGMRLTSSSLYTASGINVGIGTSLPNLLTWNRAVTTNTASGNVAYELAIGGAAQAYFAADASNIYLAGYANKPLLIRTNNTTALTIDTAQNLGLGVTPSAWSTSFSAKAFQFGPVGSLMSLQASSTNNQTFMSSNVVNLSGGWTYMNTDSATYYRQYAGTHSWFNAPSGTAGTVASFTQAMTLDASGNLGVGETSPNFAGSGYTNLVVSNSSNGGILYVNRVGGARGFFYANGTTDVSLGTTSTVPLTFQTNGTERARIDSSGNFLVGTTSGSNKLEVNGSARFYVAGNGDVTITHSSLVSTIQAAGSVSLALGANAAERFRIGTAGQLGIGGATYGTAGQVLTSGGASAAPTWSTPSGISTGKAIAMAIVFGG